MNKNIEMLKSFKNVMLNNQEEINKVVPNMYSKNFYTIDFNHLLNLGINKLIIDIDGTILPADDIVVPPVLYNKIYYLKSKGFNICLVTNNNEDRVKPVADILQVKYIYKAKKPLPIAFDNAIKILNTNNINNIAMIGDQMLTDIKGAKEYGIYTILVCPISKHQNIQTRTQRILQRTMEEHLKKKNIFDRNVFYK